MSLVAAARKLHAILQPHGILIGGICGTMHGIERFTRDVDFATDLAADEVQLLFKNEAIKTEIRHGDALDTLSWVLTGDCDGIDFQVLPAHDIGIKLSHGEVKLQLLIASEKDFIISKCLAGGQQDLHDVAVLILLNSTLKPFAFKQAKLRKCQDKLQSWLTDTRLLSRYDKQ